LSGELLGVLLVILGNLLFDVRLSSKDLLQGCRSPARAAGSSATLGRQVRRAIDHYGHFATSGAVGSVIAT
jgi:hypothetical protein